MNKSLVLLIALFFTCTNLFAQNPARVTIRGVVQDTSAMTLTGATVMLLQPKDSSLVNFARANDKGSFEFRNVKNASYLLKISYVGFLPYQQKLKEFPNDVNDLGPIKIKPIAKELLEVVVKTAKAPLSIKGDTVEYNAASFKVPPGSSVEDLLRRLPGIEVDASGNIKAQGKDVKRVLVDGKTFFGDDPKAATKNLGAETISKVQVYNGKSDQALLTGADDGKKEKTINLELKDEFKKGAFGKITAAIGTSDRGVLRGNYNRFNKKEQFSVLGYANNINETGVNWSDYGEFKGNNSFNSNDNGDFGFGNGNRFYYMEGDYLNNFDGKGFTNNFGTGVNYNYTHQKTKFSSSYFYNQTKLNLDQYQSTKTFLQNSNFTTLDTNNTVSFRNSHSVAARLEQMLDSSNTIIAKTNLRFSGSNSSVNQVQQYLNNSEDVQNRINMNNGSNLNAYNFNFTAIYRHKFKKKGRTFAASSTLSTSSTDGTDNIRSLTRFFNATNVNDQIRAISQLNQNANTTTMIKAGVNYLEPLSKKVYWESFYNFNNSGQNVGRDAFNGNLESQRYDSLSTYYQNQITYNRVGSGLRFSNDGINLSFGLAVLQYDLDGKVYPQKGKPLTANISKQYQALTPNFSANIEFKNNAYMGFNYTLNVEAPSITDLQPVVQNNNPFYITSGNQDLLPAKNHELSFDISKFDPATFASIGIWSSYRYYLSQIVYSQTVDANLVTRTRPENMSGGKNFNVGMYSSFPIIKTKWTMNLSGNINTSNTPTIVNTVVNQTNNKNYTINAGFSITPSEKLIMNIEGNLGFNNISYTIENNQNQNIRTKGLSTSVKWNFAKKTFFETSFDYNSYRNDRFGFDQEIPILNCSVRRLFMKENRMEVRLAAFDIFNKRQSIVQTGYLNTVSNQQALTLARYFMLSLTYNLKGHSDKLKKNGGFF
ncbi:TonB-dependent receptor [Flectobacillus rivi]|uniref:TonB-dependent receptor n=1 Tax=Flectobacillus rivi TaxID=2984209 RepID=A0ABT6Z7J3_9BACT|nr:TonB-dependent receptor [Flectobacillus rivi]MDI9876925.1 TonB-dependent receptor [Flectobacillus rivi]